MQRGPEPAWLRAAGWVIAGIVLLMLLPAGRMFGGNFLRLLVLGAAAIAGAVFVARSLGLGRLAVGRDELAAEEEACKTRLAALQTQADQMTATLRDLRDLHFSPEETTRARWAEVELEETLRDTRTAMAAERARLFTLETLRWFRQVEPLLRSFDRLSERSLQDWLGRLTAVRAQGAEILARLRLDGEAAADPAGVRAVELLEEALRELHALRSEAESRRAEGLAGGAPPEAPLRSSAALQRLQEGLERTRARRELRAWLSDPDR